MKIDVAALGNKAGFAVHRNETLLLEMLTGYTRLVMEECAQAVEGSEDQWITREAASALIRARMP